MNETLPGWHVLGDQIREDTVLAPNGSGLQLEYVVPYTICSGPAKGHQGVVRVAPGDYNEAAVEKAITDAVRTTHGIANLGTPSDQMA